MQLNDIAKISIAILVWGGIFLYFYPIFKKSGDN